MPHEPLNPSGSGPLAGVRVLEFAGIGPVPFAAMLLSDMGADTVCIDRPRTDQRPDKDILDRGRRSVVLDLKGADGREEALALADRADILIEGFRPGVMERLGLGPDVVLARNPRLVYGRMTGWGQTGPLALAAGHDINYIAVTGALAAIGPADGQPAPPLNLLGDYGGGALYLVTGVLAALLASRRDGAGQVVDCAMCDGAASLTALFHTLLRRGDWLEERGANLLDGGAPFYTTYECADGRHVAVGALEAKFYETLCRLTGLDGGAAEDSHDRRHWPQLRERAQAIFRTRTRDEWCALLEGTDACLAPVLTFSEAPSHPHLAARGTFVRVNGIVQPAPTPRFSRTAPANDPLPAAPPISVSEILATWAPTRPEASHT